MVPYSGLVYDLNQGLSALSTRDEAAHGYNGRTRSVLLIVPPVLYTAPLDRCLSGLTARPPRLCSRWHRVCGLIYDPIDDSHRLIHQIFASFAKVKETLSGGRDACPRSAAESNEVEGAAVVLRPRGRAEAVMIARAAGCLEK